MSKYLKELLKIGTEIDHQFIDDFYKILTNSDETFCINLDAIIYWLELNRKEFLRDLMTKTKFKENIDYVIKNSHDVGQQDIWFTVSAFKTICMCAESPFGDLVRDYFINVEMSLDRNKFIIIDHMIKELDKSDLTIKQLQLNHSTMAKVSDGGYVYVYATITTSGHSVYKIGMSKDKDKNGQMYTTHPDNFKIVAIMRTNNPESVEACLYGILKQKRYRRDCEFFHDITVSQIKTLLSNCQDMTSIYSTDFTLVD